MFPNQKCGQNCILGHVSCRFEYITKTNDHMCIVIRLCHFWCRFCWLAAQTPFVGPASSSMHLLPVTVAQNSHTEQPHRPTELQFFQMQIVASVCYNQFSYASPLGPDAVYRRAQASFIDRSVRGEPRRYSFEGQELLVPARRFVAEKCPSHTTSSCCLRRTYLRGGLSVCISLCRSTLAQAKRHSPRKTQTYPEIFKANSQTTAATASYQHANCRWKNVDGLTLCHYREL